MVVKKSKYNENWIMTNLGTVAKWGSGGTPSRSNDNFYNGNIPWIKTGELNEGYIYDTSEKITDEAVKKSSAKIFPKGSVVVAMYGATIGKTAILGVDATTNQACAVAQVNPEIIDSMFLFYYLQSQKERFIQAGKGGAQPNISQTVIKDWELNLPPFSEQQRIVNRIESLFEKIDKAQELIEEAREGFEKRKEAILAKAFRGELTAKWREENIKNPDITDSIVKNAPYELPVGWCWKLFEDVATIKSNLVDPKDFQDYPHIAPNNIEKRTGVLLDYQTIREDKVTSSKHHFYNGQIIYSKIRPYLSKVVISNFDGLCSADMYPIETELATEYLFRYILSPLFLHYVNNSGSRTVLPKINQKALNRVLIPVATFKEQNEIAKILTKVFAEEDKVNDLLHSFDEIVMLRKSILAKAFRGELGTNDPSEESAIKLLNEILANKSKK